MSLNEVVTPARSLSAELQDRTGEVVTLQGWLHHFRRLSNVSFLLLRDRTGVAQIVIDDPDTAERLSLLQHESVLTVNGTVTAEPQAPGGVEIKQPTVTVVSEALEEPPIELYKPTIRAQLPTLLDYAPVTLRHPRRRAYFRLTHAALIGYRSVLVDAGFTEIQTPKLVAAATEGGANVFPLDYFGRRAFLAQSPQLYKQMMVGVFERVFEVGPVFRAEPHDTTRHLNEYVSLDMEMGFIRDHRDVMQMLRIIVAGMFAAMSSQCRPELDLLQVEIPPVPEQIPSVHFAEALRMIGAATGEDLSGEQDLAPAHEAWLGEWARREHESEFVYVTGFPTQKRAFYTHPEPDRPEYSNSFDLLFRGLELATGGQRLHRYDDYIKALEGRGMDPEPFQGYLQAFKFGMPPHGGFGMGLERVIARVVGATNIRDTTLFPRDINRLTP
jgi:nondiscriminating aspartyl-tRNA synthetase